MRTPPTHHPLPTRPRPSARPVRVHHTRSGPVCGSCDAWLHCCYCHVPEPVVRDGVRRLAAAHVGHEADCPGCQRLRDADPRADVEVLRRVLRRIAEIHCGCHEQQCTDQWILGELRRRTR